MTKINASMTGIQMIMALSEGVIGAVSVLTQLAEEAPKHDPIPGPFGVILVYGHLDDLGIRGSRLWQLYKDVCDQKIGKMLLVLRANQLGFLPESKLVDAIGDDTRRGKPLENYDELEKQVLAELPSFKVELPKRGIAPVGVAS